MNNNLTKREIIDAIAKDQRVPRQVVKAIVQQFLDSMIEGIGKGKRLEFRDFGVFEPRERAAFTAQNPQTLKPIRVPARWVVKFKPGRKMQTALDSISEPTIVTMPNPEALDYLTKRDRTAEQPSSKANTKPNNNPKADPDDTNH